MTPEPDKYFDFRYGGAHPTPPLNVRVREIQCICCDTRDRRFGYICFKKPKKVAYVMRRYQTTVIPVFLDYIRRKLAAGELTMFGDLPNRVHPPPTYLESIFTLIPGPNIQLLGPPGGGRLQSAAAEEAALEKFCGIVPHDYLLSQGIAIPCTGARGNGQRLVGDAERGGDETTEVSMGAGGGGSEQVISVAERHWEMDVRLYYGSMNEARRLIVREFGSDIYYKKRGEHWDGYHRHGCVVFPSFSSLARHEMVIEDILEICAPLPYDVCDSEGRNHPFVARVIIFALCCEPSEVEVGEHHEEFMSLITTIKGIDA
jgi:hypothetical protein